MQEGGCAALVRQGHLKAVVGVLLIGCAVVVLVGCAGMRSEAPQEEQERNEATKEQGRSPEATASEEEARCEGTRTIKKPKMATGVFTTNDLPGCPKGGLLSDTDGMDNLAGEAGEDEVRGLGASDFIFGGAGNDDIYGGPGDDNPLFGNEGDDAIYGGDGNDSIYAAEDRQRDKLYCGEGRDSYMADKLDYVSSSCEVKMRPSKSKGIP